VHLLKVDVDKRLIDKIFSFTIRSKAQFCCCLSLRTGGIVIGYIKIVMAIFEIILFSSVRQSEQTVETSKFS
jgi:hypothetical protein